jgi:hypothetical protein
VRRAPSSREQQCGIVGRTQQRSATLSRAAGEEPRLPERFGDSTIRSPALADGPQNSHAGPERAGSATRRGSEPAPAATASCADAARPDSGVQSARPVMPDDG